MTRRQASTVLSDRGEGECRVSALQARALAEVIAAPALAQDPPVDTADPDDFSGIDGFDVRMVALATHARLVAHCASWRWMPPRASSSSS